MLSRSSPSAPQYPTCTRQRPLQTACHGAGSSRETEYRAYVLFASCVSVILGSSVLASNSKRFGLGLEAERFARVRLLYGLPVWDCGNKDLGSFHSVSESLADFCYYTLNLAYQKVPVTSSINCMLNSKRPSQTGCAWGLGQNCSDEMGSERRVGSSCCLFFLLYTRPET